LAVGVDKCPVGGDFHGFGAVSAHCSGLSIQRIRPRERTALPIRGSKSLRIWDFLSANGGFRPSPASEARPSQSAVEKSIPAFSFQDTPRISGPRAPFASPRSLAVLRDDGSAESPIQLGFSGRDRPLTTKKFSTIFTFFTSRRLARSMRTIYSPTEQGDGISGGLPFRVLRTPMHRSSS